MNVRYRRLLAAACAFFVVSTYVKLRELVITQEYHDAVHVDPRWSRLADAWYWIVFSRDEAIVFVGLAAALILLARVRPEGGGSRVVRVIATIVWIALPVLSLVEVVGLSYYATYQTPFPVTDLVFIRWARELVATANPFASGRVLIGLALVVVLYPAFALAAARAPGLARRGIAAIATGAALVLACGLVAHRPVLAGSLLSPHPAVWFLFGRRPAFERLPPAGVLTPVGPARRAYRVDRPPANLIIVILESTPAGTVFPYNPAARAGRGLLDQFGADITVFDAIFSPAPVSARAFQAIVSGHRPWSVGADPSSGAETLAEVMHRRGFRTELLFTADANLPGMDDLGRRGMDRSLSRSHWPGEERYANLLWGRDDALVFDELKRFVAGQTRESQPFFLIAGTSNPHAPYELDKIPGAVSAGIPKEAHAALVAYDFELLTDFYAALKRSAVADRTAVLIFGDHGEAFNEHPDNIIHSKNLFEENVHVACLLAAPGRLGLPAHVSQIGSLVDVRATVFDLVGLDEPAGDGVSWLIDAPERLVLSATDYGPGQLALRNARYSYVLWPTSGREALFDRTADPGERTNLAAAQPDVLAGFRRRLPPEFQPR